MFSLRKLLMNVRFFVFWPPFILLIVAACIGLYDAELLLEKTRLANHWILENFGWLFSLTAFGMVAVCGFVYLSPLGRVRIGGPNAKPILTKWRWFSITLCTTIAVGILFWAAAEPVYHLCSPEIKDFFGNY